MGSETRKSAKGDHVLWGELPLGFGGRSPRLSIVGFLLRMRHRGFIFVRSLALDSTPLVFLLSFSISTSALSLNLELLGMPLMANTSSSFVPYNKSNAMPPSSSLPQPSPRAPCHQKILISCVFASRARASIAAFFVSNWTGGRKNSEGLWPGCTVYAR